MKLYLGCRDIRPEGFKVLDIDPSRNPDIVANISNMPQVMSSSCSELVASHVLEHLEWPESFRALAEMSRVLRRGGVLKLSVPDLNVILKLLTTGERPFYAAGMIFGSGGLDNKYEQHRFGFTCEMLMPVLSLLGFGEFDWWNSELPEGANGWASLGEEKIAISLNIKAVKQEEPACDCVALYQRLRECPMREFEDVVADFIGNRSPATRLSPMVYQRIHFQLIEARQRIAYLESELSTAVKAAEEAVKAANASQSQNKKKSWLS